MKFFTDKAAKEEISRLEKINSDQADELGEAQSEIATLQDEVTAANEKAKQAEIEASAARAESIEKDETIANLTKERDDALEATAKAEGEQIDFEDKVEDGALARFQELGGEPAPVSEKDKDEKPLEMSRAAFNAMTPRQRSEFSISGGKITG